jgi:hypothetical protein
MKSQKCWLALKRGSLLPACPDVDDFLRTPLLGPLDPLCKDDDDVGCGAAVVETSTSNILVVGSTHFKLGRQLRVETADLVVVVVRDEGRKAPNVNYKGLGWGDKAHSETLMMIQRGGI